jgi:hypothetical protein
MVDTFHELTHDTPEALRSVPAILEEDVGKGCWKRVRRRVDYRSGWMLTVSPPPMSDSLNIAHSAEE